MRMNSLLAVVGLTIVSLLLASPFFLQTQNAYEREIFGQGYHVELSRDSDEATEQEEEAMEDAEENEDNDH
jgi:hypothetical protein